ncbi:MAG: DUF2911 domain-containing protein [Cyclobacteriaceae bacterium]
MKHLLISVLCLCPFIGFGQINSPDASPAATITQALGFGTVTVEYNRPQLNGRNMFEQLTREGQVWRTGANMATRLTTTEAIKIEGKELPAGKYSIYSIPGKDAWTIIINKKIQWGTVYEEAEDLMRITVATRQTDEREESFMFYFTNATAEKATLGFKWENTKVELGLEAPVYEKVLAQIKEVMADPSKAEPGDFYTASDFYLKNNLDSKKALEWANKFAEMNPDKYWSYRLQARAYAANEDFEKAIEAAAKSTGMAKEAGNEDYVFMNTRDIKKWMGKK